MGKLIYGQKSAGVKRKASVRDDLSGGETKKTDQHRRKFDQGHGE